MNRLERCIIYIGILSILLVFLLDNLFKTHFVIIQILYVVLLWFIWLILPRIIVK